MPQRNMRPDEAPRVDPGNAAANDICDLRSYLVWLALLFIPIAHQEPPPAARVLLSAADPALVQLSALPTMRAGLTTPTP